MAHSARKDARRGGGSSARSSARDAGLGRARMSEKRKKERALERSVQDIHDYSNQVKQDFSDMGRAASMMWTMIRHTPQTGPHSFTPEMLQNMLAAAGKNGGGFLMRAFDYLDRSYRIGSITGTDRATEQMHRGMGSFGYMMLSLPEGVKAVMQGDKETASEVIKRIDTQWERVESKDFKSDPKVERIRQLSLADALKAAWRRDEELSIRMSEIAIDEEMAEQGIRLPIWLPTEEGIQYAGTLDNWTGAKMGDMRPIYDIFADPLTWVNLPAGKAGQAIARFRGSARAGKRIDHLDGTTRRVSLTRRGRELQAEIHQTEFYKQYRRAETKLRKAADDDLSILKDPRRGLEASSILGRRDPMMSAAALADEIAVDAFQSATMHSQYEASLRLGDELRKAKNLGDEGELVYKNGLYVSDVRVVPLPEVSDVVDRMVMPFYRYTLGRSPAVHRAMERAHGGFMAALNSNRAVSIEARRDWPEIDMAIRRMKAETSTNQALNQRFLDATFGDIPDADRVMLNTYWMTMNEKEEMVQLYLGKTKKELHDEIPLKYHGLLSEQPEWMQWLNHAERRTNTDLHEMDTYWPQRWDLDPKDRDAWTNIRGLDDLIKSRMGAQFNEAARSHIGESTFRFERGFDGPLSALHYLEQHQLTGELGKQSKRLRENFLKNTIGRKADEVLGQRLEEHAQFMGQRLLGNEAELAVGKRLRNQEGRLIFEQVFGPEGRHLRGVIANNIAVNDNRWRGFSMIIPKLGSAAVDARSESVQLARKGRVYTQENPVSVSPKALTDDIYDQRDGYQIRRIAGEHGVIMVRTDRLDGSGNMHIMGRLRYKPGERIEELVVSPETGGEANEFLADYLWDGAMRFNDSHKRGEAELPNFFMHDNHGNVDPHIAEALNYRAFQVMEVEDRVNRIGDVIAADRAWRRKTSKNPKIPSRGRRRPEATAGEAAELVPDIAAGATAKDALVQAMLKLTPEEQIMAIDGILTHNIDDFDELNTFFDTYMPIMHGHSGKMVSEIQGLRDNALQSALDPIQGRPFVQLETLKNVTELNGLYLPRPVAKAIQDLDKNMPKSLQTAEERARFSWAIRRAQMTINFLKRNLTIRFPKFHFRNDQTDKQVLWLYAGTTAMNPAKMWGTTRLLLGRDDTLTLPGNIHISGQQMRNELRSMGIPSQAAEWQERVDVDGLRRMGAHRTLAQLRRDPAYRGIGTFKFAWEAIKRVDGNAFANLERLSTYRENYLRVHMYKSLREAGESPYIAAEKTQRAFFDYSNPGPVDRKAKNVFPFWYWNISNIRSMIEMGYKNPGRMGAMIKAHGYLGNELESNFPDEIYLPEYFNGQIRMGISGGKSNKMRMVTGLEFPIQAAEKLTWPGSFSELGENWWSMGLPPVKGFIEAFTAKRDVFTGRTFKPTEAAYRDQYIQMQGMAARVIRAVPGLPELFEYKEYPLEDGRVVAMVNPATYHFWVKNMFISRYVTEFDRFDRLYAKNEGEYNAIANALGAVDLLSGWRYWEFDLEDRQKKLLERNVRRYGMHALRIGARRSHQVQSRSPLLPDRGSPLNTDGRNTELLGPRSSYKP